MLPWFVNSSSWVVIVAIGDGDKVFSAFTIAEKKMGTTTGLASENLHIVYTSFFI